MKELYLDFHSSICDNMKPYYHNDKSFKWCEMNPDRFLFFVGNKFVLITYNSCLNCGDKYDFKKEIINKVIVDNNIFETYEINRSVNVKENLKDFRIRNKSLLKYIQQVNFIYYDNANKEYAITTKTKYLDALCNQDEIDSNYIKAREFLTKNEYTWLIRCLDKLYIKNRLYNYNETEVIRSIDHLINSINKLI